jgi:hypothetical protein
VAWGIVEAARERATPTTRPRPPPAAAHPEDPAVKYMLLIYSSPATWNALTEEERAQMERDHRELYEELAASGEWAGGNALDGPDQAKAVRVRGGIATTTDGPYAETKEHLAGYDLVECDSLERALEIAARIPDAAVCGVEVRPVRNPDEGP